MKLYEAYFYLKPTGFEATVSVEDYGVYFLMPLEDLKKLSELSYEWFEEYLPNSCCSPYPIRLLADGSVRDWEDAF